MNSRNICKLSSAALFLALLSGTAQAQVADLAGNGEGTEYTIGSAAGWNLFCNMLESG